MLHIRFGLTFFITFNIVLIVLVVFGAATVMDIRRERASSAESQVSHGMLIAESLAKELFAPLAAKDGKRLSDVTDLIFMRPTTPFSMPGTGPSRVPRRSTLGA